MEYQFVKDRRMLEYGLNGLHSDIFCFSTTRHGGYSGGNYASFNCNACCGDSETSVAQNRGLLCSLMPVRPKCLVIPHQVHRTEVRCIDESFLLEDESERAVLLEGVDALVSSLPEVCLCISTADCVPILFFDARLKIVAAAHAGWRGTVAGIAAKTLRVMADAYGTRGQDVAACIGPSISPDAFEVGDEVYEAFRSAGFRMDRIAFRRGNGTSTCGKPTGCSCLTPESCRKMSNSPASAPTMLRPTSFQPVVWESVPAVSFRASCC